MARSVTFPTSAASRFLPDMNKPLILSMAFALLSGCSTDKPSDSSFNLDYREVTFEELIEKGKELDGSKVVVTGLLSSNTAATILDPIEKLPFSFDELGVPWIAIRDVNWEFRQPMVPRVVRVFGEYHQYSMNYPTLGSFDSIQMIEMIGIKEEYLLPHQKATHDPNDPFR